MGHGFNCILLIEIVKGPRAKGSDGPTLRAQVLTWSTSGGQPLDDNSSACLTRNSQGPAFHQCTQLIQRFPPHDGVPLGVRLSPQTSVHQVKRTSPWAAFQPHFDHGFFDASVASLLPEIGNLVRSRSNTGSIDGHGWCSSPRSINAEAARRVFLWATLQSFYSWHGKPEVHVLGDSKCVENASPFGPDCHEESHIRAGFADSQGNVLMFAGISPKFANHCMHSSVSIRSSLAFR